MVFFFSRVPVMCFWSRVSMEINKKRLSLLKFPARPHFEFYDVNVLPDCFTQKNLWFPTIAATHSRHKIQNGAAREI